MKQEAHCSETKIHIFSEKSKDGKINCIASPFIAIGVCVLHREFGSYRVN